LPPKPWTDEKIRAKIYPHYGLGLPKFDTVIFGWYKYYIGEFNSYAEAKNFIENNLSMVKTNPSSYRSSTDKSSTSDKPYKWNNFKIKN